MTAVHLAPELTDRPWRRELYEGDLLLVPPSPASLELAAFARELIAEAFAPHDPVVAQRSMDVEDWVGRFAPVKTTFIHHPRTAELITQVVRRVGCDLDDTFWDVPRLRGVTSDSYLTAGVGYAHHPHRDTWYSAPLNQINWWMPLHPCRRDNVMAFHCDYFGRAVANSSDAFDYYRWNSSGRKNAARHVRSDTRVQPRATEAVSLDPELRIIGPVGSLLLFSAAHLHSTVPNTSGVTRFSLDFRTVSVSDLEAARGAYNWDSRPTGTSLRDFHRTRDFAPLPPELIERFDSGDSDAGELVYLPQPSSQ